MASSLNKIEPHVVTKHTTNGFSGSLFPSISSHIPLSATTPTPPQQLHRSSFSMQQQQHPQNLTFTLTLSLLHHLRPLPKPHPQPPIQPNQTPIPKSNPNPQPILPKSMYPILNLHCFISNIEKITKFRLLTCNEWRR